MSKRIYKSWKQEDMEEALIKLSNDEIGFNEAHRKYNIPKSTLRRHFKGLYKNTKFGRPKDLHENMEKLLMEHILSLEANFLGLTAGKNIGATKIKLEREWFCNICEEDREENMIQCLKCKGWVHDLCAGVDKNKK